MSAVAKKQREILVGQYQAIEAKLKRRRFSKAQTQLLRDKQNRATARIKQLDGEDA